MLFFSNFTKNSGFPLDISLILGYTEQVPRTHGPVAQLGERSVRIREVKGSNPSRSTIARSSEKIAVYIDYSVFGMSIRMPG